MGHGPRGLQRKWHRVGLLPARSGSLSRVSLGRRRAGRNQRPAPENLFCVALWNGQDPILKERLFGLTGSEGNHGEDVKEYYFYLDSTPTHSYMKFLYKYPAARIPLRATRRRKPAWKERAGAGTDRHRRLRRRPLLRRRCRICQSEPGRHSDSNYRAQSRAGSRRAARFFRQSGFGIRGRGTAKDERPAT